MCTAINFLDQANETVFGRTMDFYAILDPHLVSFPAGASWETMLGQTLADQYGVGGIGRHAQHRYVLFDGVNEMGLAGGALYFKGYADFPQPSKHSGQVQLSALDFLHYALGSCASLDDIRERLAMARRHARLLAAREGKNIVRMRKHAMWYLAGLPGAAAARGRINACVSVEDFEQVFDELLERVGSSAADAR